MRLDGLGHASIDPVRCHAGEQGTWVLRYTVGSHGLRRNGGIRVQLPDSWHVWHRNSAKCLQATSPTRANYVTAHATVGTVTCEVEGEVAEEYVKGLRPGLDGRRGRYVFVVRVTSHDHLVPGSQIDVVYGDTSGGSAGMQAAFHPQGPEPVLVGVDVTGQGPHRLVSDPPELEVTAGPLTEIAVIAPSMATVGETQSLTVVGLDRFGNASPLQAGDVSVTVASGDAEPLSPQPSDDSRVVVPYVARAPGVLRFSVTASQEPALSNPVLVFEVEPERHLYWGDLHSHAEGSHDAIGRDPFTYARDISRLDFLAVSDHCELWPEDHWVRHRARVNGYNQPGSFVTLLAYEATFRPPWGHHNVYFRGDDGPVMGANAGTLLDLWSKLEAGEVITIPHHTGVVFHGGEAPATVDWEYHDDELRRTIEIYSGHGQSELYDPSLSLAYESLDFSFNASAAGPHYACDAWRLGYQLGVIASSDNHHGQPGRGELGLAAVFATRLDREHIFQALHRRFTYGTTGARIILLFQVDEVQMGGIRHGDGPHNISVRVHGTAPLASVEIISLDLYTERPLMVVASWEPKGMDFETSIKHAPEDDRPRLYYARVRQQGSYRGRQPMAWSSPVWVMP